jgi:hypothetical protein
MINCSILVPKGKLRGEPYVCRPTQAQFHASPATAKCLLGGMGSGKSLALLVEVLIQALEEPRAAGWKGLIARSTWEKLISATWPMFLDCIPPPIREISQIRQSPYPQIIFPNGAEVRGMNLDDPEKFGSEELSLQAIDECGETGVAEEHFLWMIGRRRSGRGRNNILMAGHPAGRNWCWKHFFAWKEDASHRRNSRFEGWLTPSSENIHLDPEYLELMRETYPEAWLTRYLSGEFGAAEGQILTNFDADIHVVPPVQLKEFWPRYRGLDHGLTHPTCVLWSTTDLEGNLLCYREHKKRNITPAENARQVLAASETEEDLTQWTVCDPSMRRKETAGGVIQALIDQYSDAGLHCREGNNDVRASIAMLQTLLAPDPDRRFPYWHPMKGLPGSPRLFMTTECKGLRWEIEQWRWMDIKPGRPDREKVRAIDDDLVACLRYTVLERPQQAVWSPPPTASQKWDEILDELAAERGGGISDPWIGSERVESRVR